MRKEVMDKYQVLLEWLRTKGRLALAFSGGTDSSFLLQTAVTEGIDILALTVHTPYMPEFERSGASALCRKLGVDHRILELPFPEQLRNNPPERCYLCKKELFSRLWQVARAAGYEHLADGSNQDDDPEHRPGMKALKELAVFSPLREAGLKKAEIRMLAEEFGWPFWDKPAYSCLMTRLPHQQRVTEENLQRVDRAESFLREQGYREIRVRVHGTTARIESRPESIPDMAAEKNRETIHAALKNIGFQYVCLDLEGYRVGSMSKNE